jgi:nucleoid DNA-binding protein/cell division septation protein DedD
MILNLSNYIHSLLLENETVIIPGFGAFISTYKPAEINENEIKPPSKGISFTQQIKNNDGLLVEIIARKAKISQINAMKRIEKARENMFYELDKGETVVLENIGNLFYNENNEIQFVPFEEDNLLLDSFGLETISLEDSVEKMDEIETDEILVEETDDPFEGEKPNNETESIDEIESESASLPIIDESVSEVQAEKIPEVEKEIEAIQEPVSETFKLPEFKPAPKIEKPEERKKVGWYWYLLILISILIGGYFLINNNSVSDKTETNLNPYVKVEQSEIQVQTLTQPDSVKNDSGTTTIDSTVNDNQKQALTQKTTKYYLVGGSFKSEKNVEKYILQLKEKGIESFLIGKKGSLYLIGIETFDTEPEALKSLNEHLKIYPDWNLWIYSK